MYRPILQISITLNTHHADLLANNYFFNKTNKANVILFFRTTNVASLTLILIKYAIVSDKTLPILPYN